MPVLHQCDSADHSGVSTSLDNCTEDQSENHQLYNYLTGVFWCMKAKAPKIKQPPLHTVRKQSQTTEENQCVEKKERKGDFWKWIIKQTDAKTISRNSIFLYREIKEHTEGKTVRNKYLIFNH